MSSRVNLTSGFNVHLAFTFLNFLKEIYKVYFLTGIWFFFISAPSQSQYKTNSTRSTIQL